MKQIQKISTEIVEKIDEKMKGKHDVDTTMIHLMEEMGEIARYVFSEKIGRDKLKKEKIGEEFADVVILLSHLANHFDVDIEEAIKEKIEVLKERHNLE
jgi:NTP pyrophosphatase (non-canonical NTP hydrolase)